MKQYEDRLIRIEEKQDRIAELISHINVTLGEQHVDIKHHIKRTDLLEIIVNNLKKQVDMASGALKFIGLVAVLVSIAEVFMKAIK